VNKHCLAFLAAASVLAPAIDSPADWVVTKEGKRIETQGPWEVKGRLLVITLPDGKLASMRLSDVDLAASERATTEAKEQTQAQAQTQKTEEPDPAPRKKPIAQWTNADFTIRPPTSPETENSAPGTGQEGQGTAEGAAAPAAASGLAVVNSRNDPSPEDGHVILTGTVVNRSNREAVASVTVKVRLFDSEGTLLAEKDGVLDNTALNPGGQSGFFAEFQDVFVYSAVKFETSGKAFLQRPPEEQSQVRQP
jgi:hypothetical protein